MRDQHRDKRDLINELEGLRKQVTDLKQAAAERRRLEDALRREEELLRALVETAPVRLCLVTPQGEPLIANHAFAKMLGYGSPGELVRLSRDLGLWREAPSGGGEAPTPVGFKRKDGSELTVPAVRAGGGNSPMVVAVLDPPEPGGDPALP